MMGMVVPFDAPMRIRILPSAVDATTRAVARLVAEQHEPAPKLIAELVILTGCPFDELFTIVPA